MDTVTLVRLRRFETSRHRIHVGENGGTGVEKEISMYRKSSDREKDNSQ